MARKETIKERMKVTRKRRNQLEGELRLVLLKHRGLLGYLMKKKTQTEKLIAEGNYNAEAKREVEVYTANMTKLADSYDREQDFIEHQIDLVEEELAALMMVGRQYGQEAELPPLFYNIMGYKFQFVNPN